MKDILVAGQLKYFDINSRKDSSESENGSAIDGKILETTLKPFNSNQKERPDERSGPYLIGSSYVTTLFT